jgi:branched-chain amino acid transport system substrate-binding protein
VFIMDDSGFGRAGLATMTPKITAHGGEVVKTFLTPPTEDGYAAVIEEVRGLKPDVVAVINAGAKDDAVVSAVTKAKLSATTTTALLYLSDVDRIKDGYAGLVATVPWYWNLDPTARAWSDRFAAAHDGRRPSAPPAAGDAGPPADRRSSGGLLGDDAVAQRGSHRRHHRRRCGYSCSRRSQVR